MFVPCQEADETKQGTMFLVIIGITVLYVDIRGNFNNQINSQDARITNLEYKDSLKTQALIECKTAYAYNGVFNPIDYLSYNADSYVLSNVNSNWLTDNPRIEDAGFEIRDQIIEEFGSWTHISVTNQATDKPRGQALIIDKAGTRVFS